MNEDDVEKAVKYNTARGYARADWQRVQMVLGARPDGLPGSETARAVAVWQSENALAVDGMVGPNTIAAMLGDAAPWSDIERVSIYWDRPASWTIDYAGELAAKLVDHGVDVVKVMLTPSDGQTWSPSWTQTQLSKWSDALEAQGLRASVTAWGLPWPELLRDMRLELAGYLEAARALRFEVDAEEHLMSGRPSGYPADRVALMSDLVAVLDAARAAGVPACVSTYSDLFGNSDTFHNDLVSTADVFSLQAYQVEGGKADRWNSSGPALKQYDGLKRYRERVAVRPCVTAVAVALWDQDWPDIQGADAQLLSVEQCLRLGVREVDLWSAKHWLAPDVDPVKAKYNGEFLKRLKALRGC